MSRSNKLFFAGILVLILGIVLPFAVGLFIVSSDDAVITTPCAVEISIVKSGRYYLRGGDVVRDGRRLVYRGTTMPEGTSLSITEKLSRDNIPMVVSPVFLRKKIQGHMNIGYFDLNRPGKYIVSSSGSGEKRAFFFRRERSSDDGAVLEIVLAVCATCVVAALVIFILAIIDFMGEREIKKLLKAGGLMAKCASCGSGIPEKNINVFKSVAKCDKCGKAFGYTTLLDIVSDSVEGGAPKAPKGSIKKPKSFTMEHTGEGLLITRKWVPDNAARIFCWILGAFLIWGGITCLRLAWEDKLVGVDALWVVVNSVFFFCVACLCFINGFNNIRICATSDGMLRIAHYPLPWPRKKNISRGDLRQLCSKEIIRRYRKGDSRSYTVQAITHEGKSIDLVKYLLTREEALFIEQEIEKQLGITDKPVLGEVN